jgi:hypothetical protein
MDLFWVIDRQTSNRKQKPQLGVHLEKWKRAILKGARINSAYLIKHAINHLPSAEASKCSHGVRSKPPVTCLWRAQAKPH